MPADTLTLGAIKPEDSIAAFLARGLLRPSFRWQDVWQAEHARAFAVAGVMRLDILKTIRDQVDTAVANGTHFRDFRDALRKQLVAKGWWGNIEITDPATGEVRRTRFNDTRLKLIFDVNLRQSNAAGRWARAQRSSMPLLMYRTMRDERVRVSHRPWDGVVLPKDHPWWDTHYPPNGWRCRCTAFAIDQAGVDRLQAAGQTVKTEPPPTQWVQFENKATGQVESVPRGIDPGFAYNPGKVHVAQGMDRLSRGLAQVRGVPGGGKDVVTAQQLTRSVIGRMRSEKAFKDFLAAPPSTPNVGMPVAAVPAMGGEPTVASVRGTDLIRQAGAGDYPQTLPTNAAGWALAQAIIDQGQRVQLPNGNVIWWWARGAGATRRVHVLELQRASLVWWVRQLAALSVDEAVVAYPVLKGVV